jgi:hypothetical protein
MPHGRCVTPRTAGCRGLPVVRSTRSTHSDRRPGPPAVPSAAATQSGATASRPRCHPGAVDEDGAARAWPGRLGRKRRVPPPGGGTRTAKSGGVLLSQGVYPQVPSALAGLTAVFGMGTGVTPPLWPPETCCQRGLIPRELQSEHEYREMMFEPSPRPISTGRLMRCRTSTSGLSTWWSSHGPYQVNPVGALILEQASRLDAFSGYPFRRWPTSRAAGATTGTPELRPSRSSRTRDSLPQHSFGCRG